MAEGRSRVNLYSAENYREFLACIVAIERQNGRGASLRTVAEKLGIGLSTFKMVLEGSRNLSIKNIHLVARGLNLVKHEREFFESMVLRDQAEDDDVRQHYHEKLQQLRTTSQTQRFRTTSTAALQGWYASAFLIYLLDIEKVTTGNPSPDCLQRASQIFGVEADILLKLFENLRRAGILAESENGRYHIVFERVGGKIVKQRYLHEIFLECMKRMGREFENPSALFAAHTISIPVDLINSFYNDYKSLVERYMSYEGDNLEILQICTQAIPLLGEDLRSQHKSPRSTRLQAANPGSRSLPPT